MKDKPIRRAPRSPHYAMRRLGKRKERIGENKAIRRAPPSTIHCRATYRGRGGSNSAKQSHRAPPSAMQRRATARAAKGGNRTQFKATQNRVGELGMRFCFSGPACAAAKRSQCWGYV